jgi:hypothetical protein
MNMLAQTQKLLIGSSSTWQETARTLLVPIAVLAFVSDN